MMPNYDQQYPYGYNTKIPSPILKTLSYQPAVRVDYQISSALRVAFKFNAHNQNSGLRPTFGATAGYGTPIPGWNDSLGNQKPWITTMSVSANYNVGSHTFLEVLWGRTQNFYAGVVTAESSNRYNSGLQGIPDIYTTNRDVNPDYWMAGALASMVAPFYVNDKIELPQQVSFGTRTSSAIGTAPYPGWLNVNQTWDVAGSVTHVRGRHTLKAGLNLNHSFKAQNMTQGVLPMGSINFGETTNNLYDSSFGYANLALGIFNTYSQASKFIESGIVYLGVEPYIQDNWKVNNRLTLDFGLRFVHLVPEHDKYMQASNFFPDQWSAASAPALYVAGCPGGVYPCTSTRQAMNPLTGQLLGAGTTGLIGQRILGTGSTTNGIKQQGQGISDYNFEYPFLEVGPRVGRGVPAAARRQADPPRRLRDVLRPRGGELHHEPVGQPADGGEHDAVLQLPAERGAGRHLRRGRPRAERLPVCQPEPPNGSHVQRRGAVGVAAEVHARRLLRRAVFV